MSGSMQLGEGSELCFGCKHKKNPNQTTKKTKPKQNKNKTKSHFIAQERVGGVQKATELKLLHGKVMR